MSNSIKSFYSQISFIYSLRIRFILNIGRRVRCRPI